MVVLEEWGRGEFAERGHYENQTSANKGEGDEILVIL